MNDIRPSIKAKKMAREVSYESLMKMLEAKKAGVIKKLQRENRFDKFSLRDMM
jgi:hypothetical protein